MKINDLKYLIYVPSFYGFLTFTFFYICYSLKVIEYYESNIYLNLLCLISILGFFFSSLFYLNSYKTRILQDYQDEKPKYYFNLSKIKKLIYTFYAIGFLGFFLYLKNILSFFGGLNVFLGVLMSEDSTQIRIESENFSDSIGIQLSYFSWLAAGLSLIIINKIESKKIFYILILFTFIQNLLFIDRTRPMWIICVLLFCILPFIHKKISNFKILIYTSIFAVSMYGLFSLIAVLAGKSATEKQFKGWDISPTAQNFIYYGTSSFAYFNQILEKEDIQEFELDRTIYPMLKMTSFLGLNEQPSSLVNEFYFVPSPTNVGTYLEPFYRDGEYLYAFFGIFLHTILLNVLGLYFLKSANPFGLFAYANICYVNLMAFFTPKLNNFPVWLFIIIALYFMMVLKSKQINKDN